MKLAEVLEKFPDHINYGKRADICYKGCYVGQVYQDSTECIYEATSYKDTESVKEFLSQFKYKKLLSTNAWGYRLYLYLLQEILDE